jgi:hypothetical protein
LSKIALSGNASGTGTFTIASPNSNSDRTLNLPDASGTIQVSGNPISGTSGTFTGAVSIGAGWTIEQSGTDLLFKYAGANVFKLTSAGAVVAKDNVTAYGTV